MRFGEKLRRVHIKRSRGREFVVEIPKLTEPDYTHKEYEEAAARVAGLDYTWGVYHSGDEFIKSLKNSEKIIAKTKKDAIAGAHILSALHILYGIYHGGLQEEKYRAEELAKKIGYVVDSEDEKHFKKAVGFVEWLSGNYPKKGNIILPSPDEIEERIDEIANKIAIDLGVRTPEEKEKIKEYILAAVKTGRAIADSFEALKPEISTEIETALNRALQLEKNSLVKMYLIRKKIGEEKRSKDPHHTYPKIIKEDINRIIQEESKKAEEERKKKAKEIERKLERLLSNLVQEQDPKMREEILKSIQENTMPEAIEELAKRRPELVKEYIKISERLILSGSTVDKIMGLQKKGIPLAVIAKFRPDLVKEYIEHKIKTEGLDPKELLENEQGLLEREFLEEFLREQGYLEKVEKKAEEIREKVEETKETPVGLPSFNEAVVEVLSILNGLEFAGFTEEAKRKAVEKLSARIEELLEKELTPENLQRLGLYAFAVEMIKRGNFERLREIEGL